MIGDGDGGPPGGISLPPTANTTAELTLLRPMRMMMATLNPRVVGLPFIARQEFPMDGISHGPREGETPTPEQSSSGHVSSLPILPPCPILCQTYNPLPIHSSLCYCTSFVLTYLLQATHNPKNLQKKPRAKPRR